MSWIGHILVPNEVCADKNVALAQAEFLKFFDSLEISLDEWKMLENVGIWLRLSAAADVSIDLYEEWVQPKSAAKIIEFVNQESTSGRASHAAVMILEKIGKLAYLAHVRQRPLIFVF